MATKCGGVLLVINRCCLRVPPKQPKFLPNNIRNYSVISSTSFYKRRQNSPLHSSLSSKRFLCSQNSKNSQNMADQAVYFEHPTPSCARIMLNRPKQLNALTLPMIHQIYPKMKAWAQDDRVKVVLMKGNSPKAFCAGGDVVALVTSGASADKRIARMFMFDEYKLNYLIGTYEKPFVALLNGFTMGGGVGLSVHGAYRVSTDNTVFAMPETAIGLFPDVGGSYFLPRLRGQLGTYLALTGDRLKGVDCLHAGIATHHCRADMYAALESELVKAQSRDDIDSILTRFQNNSNITDTPFSLTPHLATIDRIFALSTVEEIFQALADDGGEWSRSKLEHMRKLSPTSLKVTLKQIRAGARMSFEEIFTMEYRICQHMVDARRDFYEGVRALLIDKDNQPQWDPARLEDVTDEMVDSYFAPLATQVDGLRELDVREPMDYTAEFEGPAKI